MLRFAADENFNRLIVRGLLLRQPALNIVSVQQAGLAGAKDDPVLEWAAGEGRILLTHDASTMPEHALDRMAHGKGMSGIIVVNRSGAIGRVIEDILLVVGATTESEWQGRIEFLPY